MTSDTVWSDDDNKTVFVIESSRDGDGVTIITPELGSAKFTKLSKKEALNFARILIEHVVSQGVY